jgi:hypothetical protein
MPIQYVGGKGTVPRRSFGVIERNASDLMSRNFTCSQERRIIFSRHGSRFRDMRPFALAETCLPLLCSDDYDPSLGWKGRTTHDFLITSCFFLLLSRPALLTASHRPPCSLCGAGGGPARKDGGSGPSTWLVILGMDDVCFVSFGPFFAMPFGKTRTFLSFSVGMDSTISRGPFLPSVG